MGQRHRQTVVISFGCVTTGHGDFWNCAAPSIQRVIESDSLLMRRHEPESFADALNEMLGIAVLHDDLECVVLIDENASILDASFMQRIRMLLAESMDIALIGGDLLVVAAKPAAEIRFDLGTEDSLSACAAELVAVARARNWRVMTSSERHELPH